MAEAHQDSMGGKGNPGEGVGEVRKGIFNSGSRENVGSIGKDATVLNK